MESQAQRASSSGGQPLAPDLLQNLPQAPISASMTQAQASMAFTGHVQPTPTLPLQNTLVPLMLKLDRNNFAIWRSLVLPVVRALGLEGFLDGSYGCPDRFVPNLAGEGSSSGAQAQI